MTGSKSYAAPCVFSSKMSKFDGEILLDPTEYRHVVGALQYCTITRAEIAYSVNQLCQHMYNPTTTHWIAAKRVLRYLKGTLDHGLLYTRDSLQLTAYSDADWASNPDDRKSTTGFGIFLGSCLISWGYKKLAVVSQSSTEAGIRAMAITTTELYWIRMEKVINGDILDKFIPTERQVADLFTKGHTAARFLLLKDKLQVSPPPLSLKVNVRDKSQPESMHKMIAGSHAN
ncbi:uncharacterized protein LOC111399813 [Olea europaea var. sylvestris]|uniref:uncharacterized protein LOC111399813 n=1 Tax=Olea europaea var. sylvestris TaxID=158386 RepID=UPI000C1D7DB0|nr:uncharacterized protein LOC111399813 [Olea europaea var. sylvestris]